MKHHLVAWALPAAALVLSMAWSPLQGATIEVGSGPLSSNLVLESPNIGTRTYVINYGTGPSAPVDTYDLFTAVLAAESQLTATILNFGTASEPNFFITGLTWNGVTETNTATDPFTPSWVQWVSGGEAGFPTAAPIASGPWTLGSGISEPFRTIAPGSWDALVYADFDTVPSVPEPGSLPLVAGAIALALIRCRSRS